MIVHMVINVLIFLIGLLIYAGYGWQGFAYLAAAVLLSYGTALLHKKARWLTWVWIAVNAAMLLMLKLQPVTGLSWLAPMGVSYFTLQIISYNVDVYRGKYDPERNLFRYALFVTYIPHLFIGPIERYDSMKLALDRRRITWEGVFDGAARAIWGLVKKYVIAARVGIIVSAISVDPDQYRGAYALAVVLLYSLQLYSDFSGGIDMVLGLSRMLGITMSENFDVPYLSESFREFWRRWHMTLGSWLREYVYIPLGGNRKGKFRKLLNTVITFLVSGLWHGVRYLLWGVINGIFVAVGEKLKCKWKTVNRVGTFLLVSLLWCFFVWPDTVTALTMAGSIFTTFNYGDFVMQIGTMGLSAGDWIVLAVAALALWGYDVNGAKLRAWFRERCPAVKTAVICTLALICLVFGVYGIGFNAEAFIYSRF